LYRANQIEIRMKNLFVLSLVIVVLASMLASALPAQTFKTLHSFTATDSNSVNSDGANPDCGLVLSGNTAYGTTAGGGSGYGTVFSVNTDGIGFTTVYTFTGGSDGAKPWGRLVLSGNTLYGMTAGVVGLSYGTLFSVNTDGTGFTTLYSFTGGSDGAYLNGGLVLSGNTLYGSARRGGDSGNGTVFKVNTDSSGFTTLYSFTAPPPYAPFTNSDGAQPSYCAVLSLAGGTLYGETWIGGGSGDGTVFKLNTDGTGFTDLHNFTGSDGFDPNGGLVLSGDTLYGTATGGGSSGKGTVFEVNTDGTGFNNLHNFTGSDGGSPGEPLRLVGLNSSGGTLYGTTQHGGDANNGTVFRVNTDGGAFTRLYSFTASLGSWPSLTNNDGAVPLGGGLILANNMLYGTTLSGGSSGNGTIFSISLPSTSPPQLGITPVGQNVVLVWPTNATGFTLQSTTNLGSPVWTTNLPAPIVIDGQNTVTNVVSGTQQFFRLSL
jgi:uncharacterized repeat protein (TIGR03803 family)